MKKLLVPAVLLGLLAPAWGQEGKEKKGDPPREGRKEPGKPPAPCGKGRGEVAEAMKKQGLGGEDLEAFVNAHFKANHPEGPCHCSCGHEKEGGKPKGKPEKGNNGVGNGEDPQPPGKPPVNDGPGSKPGAPGNRGGDKK